MFYDILEKKSYYNKAQAHFLGGAKQRESLEGKSQKFINQLKQGLPENIQNSIQGAYDRGKPISPGQRNKIDAHIRQVASTQNRGQRTNVNTKGRKRTFIGPSGQGFADRGMYTGELYNRPKMRAQIVQEDVPRARSGRRGISSVTGHSSKRSPSSDKIQLRDIEIQRARDERAVLKKQRKLKGAERKKSLELAKLKQKSTDEAISNFAADKAQRNVKPKVVKKGKSNKVKIPRKQKKKLKKALMEQQKSTVRNTPISSAPGTEIARINKPSFTPTAQNNPNLLSKPKTKVTAAERFTGNLKKAKASKKVTESSNPLVRVTDKTKSTASSTARNTASSTARNTARNTASSTARNTASSTARNTASSTARNTASSTASSTARNTASSTARNTASSTGNSNVYRSKGTNAIKNKGSNLKRNIGLGLGAATVIGAGLAYRRYKKNKEQKRRASMKKVAYNNYYSDYLSPAERLRAFREAKEEMAARELGLNTEASSGRLIGGIGGGLVGLGAGLEAGIGPGSLLTAGGGALIGGGLGHLVGSSADRARDMNTREARELIKSKANLKRGLAGRRARMYDARDEEVREMDRADVRSRRIQAHNTGRPSVVIMNRPQPRPASRVIIRPRSSGAGRVVVRQPSSSRGRVVLR